MRVSGAVRDVDQQQPIVRAVVTLSVAGTEIAVLETSEDGVFEQKNEESYIGQVLHYHVEKQGYVPVADSRTFEGDTLDLQIALSRPDRPRPAPPPPPKETGWGTNAIVWLVASVIMALLAVVLSSKAGSEDLAVLNHAIIWLFGIVLVARWPAHLATMLLWVALIHYFNLFGLLFQVEGTPQGRARNAVEAGEFVIVLTGINLLILVAIDIWGRRLASVRWLQWLIKPREPQGS